MIPIIYEDNHLLVINKPVNIPVQEDASKDVDVLSILKQYIKEKYHKPGRVYLGLVHRLDRPTSGLMVFARTSKAAERLSKQLASHQFEKVYYAVIDGTPPKEKDTLKDRLVKDTKTNMVKVSETGKKAELSYEVIKKVEGKSLVKIHLKTGRSHQIRVQFSTRGFALTGDQKYNTKAKVGEQLALFAGTISFMHPTTSEKMTFTLPLPNRYPFTLFF